MSIQYAILGFLSEKPSTGYDLKKLFEESSVMYWSGNNNQIYKSLLQLQEEGFVRNETIHQEGAPSKKIYTITASGIDHLKKWIVSPCEAPEFKKPFLIRLSWSGLLDDQELLKLLEDYENEIYLQLVMHEEKKKRATPAKDPTCRDYLLWDRINENVISSFRNELDWIRGTRKALFPLL